jgi:hypothetical protein
MTTRLPLRCVVAFLIAGFASTSPADADQPAVTVSNITTGGSGPDSVYGWSFTPLVDIEITALGVFDTYQNGLYEPHPVGLWSMSNTSEALVTATIPAGTAASREGYFRYMPVTRTLLSKGGTYVLGAYYLRIDLMKDDWTVYDDGATVQVDPLIVPGTRRAKNYTGGLQFPTTVDSNRHFELGPGFKFVAVPEPSTFVLLGMGAVGLLGFAWRRRKTA